jgi:aspartyl-tRNA(Asn)/glutamyl-tRNA(Gln) amidotransferase subunit C
MTLTLDDVARIAALARLELSADQQAQYRDQLSAILDYAAVLEQLDLADVPPTTRAVPMRNVWREDVAETPLTVAQVLANAPQSADNQFVIQAVLDDQAA